MKNILILIVFILISICLVILMGLSYVKFALPNILPEKGITIEASPQRLERGAYLANHVCVCIDCHSTRDWDLFSGPIKAGTIGIGGEVFDQKYGFPGSFISKNITPAGIGNWTDAELLRAISCGVNKNNKALFPIMPYLNYGKMDREDIYSVITYIRSLPAIEHKNEASNADFPMSLILNTIPSKASYTTKPSEENRVLYGAYLVNAASCNECHTQKLRGNPIKGMEFAGGFEFTLPKGGIVRSTNITPDMETGIGTWTESDFVNKFKAYADSNYHPQKVAANNFNTVMPWTMYAHMKDNDLKAIYAYLKTVKPIKNVIVKFNDQ